MDFKYLKINLRERSTHDRISSEIDDLCLQLTMEIKSSSISVDLVNRFNSAKKAHKNFCNEVASHYNILPENFITICEGLLFYRPIDPIDILPDIIANNHDNFESVKNGLDSVEVSAVNQ